MQKNPEFHAQASAHELKSRLNGGEPALTIIDIRNSEDFRQRRILGAINIPLESLVETVKSRLELSRDIYIYSASEEETAQAADSLRQAGFRRVAELKGGIEAFQAVGGSLEGITTDDDPGSSQDNFNVFARLQKHAEEKAKEKSM